MIFRQCGMHSRLWGTVQPPDRLCSRRYKLNQVQGQNLSVTTAETLSVPWAKTPCAEAWWKRVGVSREGKPRDSGREKGGRRETRMACACGGRSAVGALLYSCSILVITWVVRQTPLVTRARNLCGFTCCVGAMKVKDRGTSRPRDTYLRLFSYGACHEMKNAFLRCLGCWPS